MTVEVKLLNYTFRFRNLSWREEFSIHYPPGKNPTRIFLATALEEVSGISVNRKEATKVMAPIPLPVLNRLYIIYRGLLPKTRKFETGSLYAAPEPSIYVKRVAETEDKIEQESDKVVREMESKFGKKEVEEAAEIDRQIVAGSKYRGAVKID
jgi:hypothetical protein